VPSKPLFCAAVVSRRVATAAIAYALLAEYPSGDFGFWIFFFLKKTCVLFNPPFSFEEAQGACGGYVPWTGCAKDKIGNPK
jgi:hypothetical protein